MPDDLPDLDAIGDIIKGLEWLDGATGYEDLCNLLAFAREQGALLVDLEWSGWNEPDEPACPRCMAPKSAEIHRHGCKLARLIGAKR